MPLTKASQFLKETFLSLVGALAIIIALIGFFTVYTTHVYSISHSDTHPNKKIFKRTTGTLEYVQSIHPVAQVTKLQRGLPVKSFLILAFGFYIMFRKYRSKRDDTKSLRLLNALKHNKKIKLVELSNRLGMDRHYIIEALPELNQEYGTSYSLNFHTNMIVDNESTVEWKLNQKCENCGAVANQDVILAVESESLACPYCSSQMHDAEFERYKKEKRELTEIKKNKFRYMPKFLH